MAQGSRSSSQSNHVKFGYTDRKNWERFSGGDTNNLQVTTDDALRSGSTIPSGGQQTDRSYCAIVTLDPNTNPEDLRREFDMAIQEAYGSGSAGGSGRT